MTSQCRQHALARAIFAALITTATALPAAAQSVPEEGKTETRDASTLDAVIVTVERREQDLQKYAGTAQVISAEDTRALGINNELRNIQALVPGLSMANQEGNLEIFIRGVGSSNNTELGDPGAAPHINGATSRARAAWAACSMTSSAWRSTKARRARCAAATHWPARSTSSPSARIWRHSVATCRPRRATATTAAASSR
ncbi:hypothetical protein [Stenotrophomonas pictorum]|uniref:hypothetical protein n=1 Tax=Stenotrophomonas pictorum TaxID=86184 RepID=UPI000B13ED3E|nr:hypothetical protein [Stenotrophomonas pictorum]